MTTKKIKTRDIGQSIDEEIEAESRKFVSELIEKRRGQLAKKGLDYGSAYQQRVFSETESNLIVEVQITIKGKIVEPPQEVII